MSFVFSSRAESDICPSSQTLTSAAPGAMVTNIDQAEEDALRDQLDGRTGDTESEPEEDDVNMADDE